MIPLTLILDAEKDSFFKEMNPPAKIIHVTEGLRMCRLTKGTSTGKSTVFIEVPLPDGTWVVAETTVALLQTAAAAFKGADERDEAMRGSQ